MEWVLKNKFYIIVAALVIILLLMWRLGAVDAGLGMAKKLLASKEIAAAEQLKLKLDAAEIRLKQNETRAKNLETKVASKERELVQVRSQLQDVQRRLKDAEQRLANITIPERLDDRVKRLRELGLKSATTAPKPK